MDNRVAVAMSGGVDSSVAAALLQKNGHEVIGVTMSFDIAEPVLGSNKPFCCGMQGVQDARAAAEKLGIKHYVFNMRKELEERVIRGFCLEYLRGKTPNPCVQCNQQVKFKALLNKALSLGAAYLATGHYARIAASRQSLVTSKHYLLKKAKDKHKDQSYFLYGLNQRQLKHLLFPLGNYTKDKVRKLAQEFELPSAGKLDSQEICFLPQIDYREFLKARLEENSSMEPGDIVDKKGNILGRHKGVAFYTIGQREGLGIALGCPVYVIKIDAKHNRIILGKKTEAFARECLVKKNHFIFKTIKKKTMLRVKIRYNHKGALAEIIPLDGKIKLRFKTPQFAITPGQSAVFYDKDEVFGGGIIDRVLG